MLWGLSKGYEEQVSLETPLWGGRKWMAQVYLEVLTNNQNPKTLPDKYTKHCELYVWVKSDMVKAKGLREINIY